MDSIEREYILGWPKSSFGETNFIWRLSVQYGAENRNTNSSSFPLVSNITLTNKTEYAQEAFKYQRCLSLSYQMEKEISWIFS